MTKKRSFNIADILTESEIQQAWQMYQESRLPGASLTSLNTRLVAELIAPNMARINAALGQENDARFIAYAVEYILSESEIAERKRSTRDATT